MSIIFSIKKIEKEIIITLCDEECFGKTYETEEIDFFVNPRFYDGEKKDEKEILNEIKKATIINAVGKESVKLCLNNNLISPENIMVIGGVMHCQIIKMKKNFF